MTTPTPKRTVPAPPRPFDVATMDRDEVQQLVDMAGLVKMVTSEYFRVQPVADRSDDDFAAYMANALQLMLPHLGYWRVTSGGEATPAVQWALAGPGATSPQPVTDWEHLQEVADRSTGGLRRFWRLVGPWCDDTVRDVRTTEK